MSYPDLLKQGTLVMQSGEDDYTPDKDKPAKIVDDSEEDWWNIEIEGKPGIWTAPSSGCVRGGNSS